MDPTSAFNMMDAIVFATSLYVFISGITGKGAVYKDDTIHKSRKEDFHKAMRIFCFIGGPLGVAGVAATFFKWPRFWTYFFIVAFLAAIVILCIKIWPMNKERVIAKNKKNFDEV